MIYIIVSINLTNTDVRNHSFTGKVPDDPRSETCGPDPTPAGPDLTPRPAGAPERLRDVLPVMLNELLTLEEQVCSADRS